VFVIGVIMSVEGVWTRLELEKPLELVQSALGARSEMILDDHAAAN
jgi:hypothetical protein